MPERRMATIKCLETGLVYRNPKPYLRSVHAYFPSITVLSVNEILATLVLGSAFESVDCHVYIARSRDSGKTWTMEGSIYESSSDRPTSETCRITRMADGEIVAFGARYDRSNPEEGLTNHKTLGFVPVELILFRSRDDGCTWSGPEVIEPPLVGPSFEICCPILSLKDGLWLAPTSTWKGWNGECPNGMKAIALCSYDRGRTWPECVDVMDNYANHIIYWEQKIIELDGDRLLSVAWAFNEATGKDLPNQYAISENGGRCFGRPQSTGLLGQTLTPILLEDGRILSIYRRMDKPGLWANVSYLKGNRWINETESPLWGIQVHSFNKKGPTKNMADAFNILKFGAPCATILPNGEVFVAFWCVEECVSNIRWFRLQVH